MNNNDTLFEDATGHAADLFEEISEGGLPMAVEMLQMSPEDMGMEDDTCHMLAIEAICAAAGQPSSSSECGYIREWGEGNPASVDSSVKERMLSVIDQAVGEGADNEIAERMRARIRNLG